MARTGDTDAKGARGGQLASVYDRLKTDIITLALRPGQDLDEVTLSNRYGVSRTPVREALIRLSTERLVEIGRNRGARVTALIISDLPRYLEALDLMRRAAARLAPARRTTPDLEKIDAARAAFADAAERGDDLATARAEKNFEVAVAEAGHNSYVTESYDGLLTIGLRMMRIPYGYELNAGPSVREYAALVMAQHEALAAAVGRRDADEAEALARQGLRMYRDRLRAYFDENLLDSISVRAGTDDLAPAG